MSATQQLDDILTAIVRPAGKGDWGFVIDSWTRSLSASRHRVRPTFSRRITDRIYALRRRKASFSVAVDPEHTDQILGWACAEHPILHYVFVKELYREQGIGLFLLADLQFTKSPILCSEWTSYADLVGERRPELLRKVLP